MEKYERLANFVTGYTEDNCVMDKVGMGHFEMARDELYDMMRAFSNLEEEQQLIEHYLRNILEKQRENLKSHSRTFLPTEIAFPLDSNVKNSLDVVDRLLTMMKKEGDGGLMNEEELLKTIAELEPLIHENDKL